MDNETRNEWRALATALFADPDAPRVLNQSEADSRPLHVKSEGTLAPPSRNGVHNLLAQLFW